jgi:hypothetical protein
VLAAAVVIVVPVALLVVPILTHGNQGVSIQADAADPWPTAVTAVGDDGRTRELGVVPADPGAAVDTSALAAGDRVVVSGSGYDASRGVYVAICAVPDSPAVKPGPCLGGVPDQEGQPESDEGAVQFAPSNWINDEWAWRLFGARAFDDIETGTFTAYLEVPEPTESAVDCRAVECAIVTRNDHTASSDRVQDVHIPVGFAG